MGGGGCLEYKKSTSPFSWILLHPEPLGTGSRPLLSGIFFFPSKGKAYTPIHPHWATYFRTAAWQVLLFASNFLWEWLNHRVQCFISKFEILYTFMKERRNCLHLLRLPQENPTDWVAKTTDIYFLQFWKLEGPVRVPACTSSGEALCLSCRWPPSSPDLAETVSANSVLSLLIRTPSSKPNISQGFCCQISSH